MCGEGAVTDWMCQRWYVKFCAGDFSLDNAPRLGGPVEVDSNQIKTLIENSQCYTMQVIANIPKISKSIKLLVKMRNVALILQKNPYGLLGQPSMIRYPISLWSDIVCNASQTNLRVEHFWREYLTFTHRTLLENSSYWSPHLAVHCHLGTGSEYLNCLEKLPE